MNATQDKPKFVYVTLIASTPEKVWAALTDPETTRQYWFGAMLDSDWRVGSPVACRWREKLCDEGVVLESDPPRLLSFTWRHMLDDGMGGEAPSRVTIKIETLDQRPGLIGDGVRLTVIHDDFQPESKLFHGISKGWPSILSNLKTLLETGRALSVTKEG